jgi:hypothetical protein
MRLLAAMLVMTLSTHALAAPKFVRGHNICGVNTASWRKAHGLRVPRNPASARAWLSLPRSYPHFGAVMVVSRPGGKFHASPVLNAHECENPSSSRQGWVRKSCNAIWRGRWRVFVN